MSRIKATKCKNGATVHHTAPNVDGRVEITHDDIRCRAYEIYCKRCDTQGEGGDHFSDWLRAEQELNRAAIAASATDQFSGQHESRSQPDPQDQPELSSQRHDEQLVNA